jgi:hypothetical protein
MNPTQIFEFVMNSINQKIIKFNWVPLAEITLGPVAQRGRDARPGLASIDAARAAQPGRPAQRMAHGGAMCGSGAARRAGGGMALVRGKRPRSGGSPARGRRTAARRRRARLRSGRRRGQ